MLRAGQVTGRAPASVSGKGNHLSCLRPNIGICPSTRTRAGSAGSIPELDHAIIHEALVNGFGWVMLYGGLGVWIMAAISFYIFSARSVREEVQCPGGS